MTIPIDIPLDRLEFHRNGLALFPGPEDPQPGVSLLVGSGKQREFRRWCGCPMAKIKTCPHQIEMNRIAASLFGEDGRLSLYDTFQASPWCALTGILASGETPDTVLLRSRGTPRGLEMMVLSALGKELALFRPGAAAGRLQERLSSGKGNHRGGILKRLTSLTLTENERAMNQRGFRSRTQGVEESIWHRIGCHCFMEYPEPPRLSMKVDAVSGVVRVLGEGPRGGC